MRQVLVAIGVVFVSACASSSVRPKVEPAPIVVAVPLPQCTPGEPSAVEDGYARCICPPADKVVCQGRNCSCVSPEPNHDDGSVIAFLLGLAIGVL